MFRRFMCSLAALGVLAMMAVPVMAGEEFGSIRVTLQNGESVVPDGAVELFWVGIPTEGGYWLSEQFGGGIVKENDALSPALAEWLSEMADGEGTVVTLDEEGSAQFDELAEGLYLVRQSEASTGYHLMEPMTVMMPCEYQWHIQAYPKTEEIIYEIPPELPATGQSPAPFFGAAGMLLSGTGLVLCGFKKRKTA